MIITDYFHKIKSRFDIDRLVFVYSFVIILVGVSSFGLGYLYKSVSAENEPSKNITIEDKDISSINSNIGVIVGKNYVASKNGKMFYPSGCSSASRIKEENQIWFSTREEAISSGYELSSTCK